MQWGKISKNMYVHLSFAMKFCLDSSKYHQIKSRIAKNIPGVQAPEPPPLGNDLLRSSGAFDFADVTVAIGRPNLKQAATTLNRASTLIAIPPCLQPMHAVNFL